MNWRAEPKGPVVSVDDLAQRILNGLAQPGVHRALFDLKTWTLLKWLDEPCSFYDWRGGDTDQQRVHPDDEPVMESMTKEFADGATSRVLRMRGFENDWVPVHVTVNRVELEPDTFAGLVSLRLPTDSELDDVGLTEKPDRLGAGRSRPRGGLRHPGKGDAHPRGDDDVEAVDTAAGVVDAHLAGHRRRTGAGRGGPRR